MNTDLRARVLFGGAVLGAVATIFKIRDDIRNYQALQQAAVLGRAVRFGPRWLIATASLVSSFGQLGVWAGFLGTGLIALSTPADSPHRVRAGRIMYVLLILMELTLASVQLWQIVVRAQVRAPWMLTHVGTPPTEERE